MVLVGSGGRGEFEITVDSPEEGVGEAVATNEAVREVKEGSRSTAAVEKELIKPTVVVEGAMPACSETVTVILLPIIW